MRTILGDLLVIVSILASLLLSDNLRWAWLLVGSHLCARTLFITALASNQLALAHSTSTTAAAPPAINADTGVPAAAEEKFLRFVGLQRRPRPSKKVMVPPDLWDLYRQMTSQPQSQFTRPKLYDTVRSMYPKVIGRGAADDLHFDLELFSPASSAICERVQRATLHLQLKSTSNRNASQPGASTGYDSAIRVNVYEAFATHRVLVDTVSMNASASARFSLDVTESVVRWSASASRMGGAGVASLEVEVWATSPADGNAYYSRVLDAERVIALNHAMLQADSPVLVVYYARCDRPLMPDSSPSMPAFERRVRRNAQRRQHNKHKGAGHRRKTAGGVRAGACQRNSMYVHFESVGWSDWILAPPGYEAHYCAGECEWPHAQHMNTSNHAIVQALVHNLPMGSGVPGPCCIPTELSPVSLLYVDEFDRVTLKTYHDMTVEACGCA